MFHAAYHLVIMNVGAFIFRHTTDTMSSWGFRNLYMQTLGRADIFATFLNNNRLLFSAWGKIFWVHIILA